MRLKKLELLGYKTFASQTEFVFDRGITAVIGPNGSGKSNVADAIRWVLGEQSFSLLRAKKSDDMIFSGSEQRARMGMAEATMTLDNEQRWLPIEFGEVTITRRSYRDGQNEYLLNGSKVRLRDIIDLLGKSGLSKRTYTVIGQGLIDTALSLRPQERRDLIEEAAGITLYRSRRADALSKLDATKQNLLRVHDLVSEIGPQLKRLERQAERAQEYTQISEELDKALRIWYSYQWRRGRRELERVRTISRHQQERLCEQQALVQEWSTHIAQLRAMHSDWRQKLNQWHRQRNALHARSEACQRNLAVAGERQRMLEQQREQVQAEIEALVEDKVALGKQIAAQSSELAELDEVLAGQRARVQAAQAALDERHKKVDALAAARSLAQNILLTLRTQIAEHKSRLSQLDERQQDLEQEQTGIRRRESSALVHVIGEAARLKMAIISRDPY